VEVEGLSESVPTGVGDGEVGSVGTPEPGVVAVAAVDVDDIESLVEGDDRRRAVSARVNSAAMFSLNASTWFRSLDPGPGGGIDSQFEFEDGVVGDTGSEADAAMAVAGEIGWTTFDNALGPCCEAVLPCLRWNHLSLTEFKSARAVPLLAPPDVPCVDATGVVGDDGVLDACGALYGGDADDGETGTDISPPLPLSGLLANCISLDTDINEAAVAAVATPNNIPNISMLPAMLISSADCPPPAISSDVADVSGD